MRTLQEAMMKRNRTEKLMSGMLALAVVDEAKKRFNGYIPKVREEALVIEQDIQSDKVTMRAIGELGNELGNPNIQFMFNEYLRKEDLMPDEEMNRLVYENYIALANLRYNKTEQSKKEFRG